MSDSFRYLDNADSSSAENAASSFLQDKLKKQAKGRYTSEQLERLGQSGGFAVVNSSDGAATDGAPAYDAENPTKNGGSGSSDSSDGYRGFDPDSDSGRNYSTGAWGKGDLDAEGLAKKFGLDRSQEGEGEGHIWGTLADGEKVYIGKSNEGHMSNSELIKAHSLQANPNEGDHSSLGEDLSSTGDVAGAILTQWKGGSGKEGGVEKKNDPIEHSPEIKQAIDRVRTYENDVMSGKMSEDIFGKIGGDSGPSATFDSSKGMAGIGTEGGVTADNSAYKATNSFLDNKKTAVKKEFNFQPVQTSYGS